MPNAVASFTHPLKVLHTSDWHLGRRLYGRARYEEFAAFLAWLLETIEKQAIDVLIVAGDIFDTMTPSNQAQTLYFEFLGQVSKSCCQHVVIVAGNHDSPSFLDAPKQVLKFLDVHVVGTACENACDEVITLWANDGAPQAIIAAVPYLRDRDVRQNRAGQSFDEKDASVIAGICQHYDSVAAEAKRQQSALHQQFSAHVPIIATGHLFAAGGSTTEDDGVRNLYVGNLGKISADMFDDCFDYVALGHLHVPQLVGGRDHIRYSGSPIAMGFGEARQQKQLILIEFSANGLAINPLFVPCFQKIAQISGDLMQLRAEILKLAKQNDAVWLEVIYTGDELVSNLREQIASMTQGTTLEVLKTKNPKSYHHVLKQEFEFESLQDLDESEVFERCLEAHDILDHQKIELRGAYDHIIAAMSEQDHFAD